MTAPKINPCPKWNRQLRFPIAIEGVTAKSTHAMKIEALPPPPPPPRFPRINRWRQDKSICEANTLEDVMAAARHSRKKLCLCKVHFDHTYRYLYYVKRLLILSVFFDDLCCWIFHSTQWRDTQKHYRLLWKGQVTTSTTFRLQILPLGLLHPNVLVYKYYITTLWAPPADPIGVCVEEYNALCFQGWGARPWSRSCFNEK